MSRYTTEFRYILQNEDWTDERLGLGEYPIFDEEYRSNLNTKIKNHFYFDEIGSETPARFAQRLNNKMCNIMPYYNQLYKSTLLEIFPFLSERMDKKDNSFLTEILNALKKSDTVNNAIESDKKNVSNNDIKTGHSTSTENDTNDTQNVDTKHTLASGIDGERMGYASVDHGHSMGVESDTPEGFIQTDTIDSGTYANSASKNEFRNEKDGHDSDNKNFIHDTYDYNTATSKQGSTKEGVVDNLDTDSFQGLEDGIKNSLFNQILNELSENVKNTNQVTDGHSEGFNGRTMSQMLTEFRGTFLNIDLMILQELEVLFIGLLN